jgi:hypothetical protein
MNELDIVETVLAVLGAISMLCTFIAVIAPTGSKVGYVAAKIGADLKAQTVKATAEHRRQLAREEQDIEILDTESRNRQSGTE